MRRAERLPLAGIEASTTGIKVLLAGFDLFPSILKKLLEEHRIVEPGTDGRQLTKDKWFPLEAWLAVHDVIYKEMPTALLSLGAKMVANNPNFPPFIRDVPHALESLDVAYHKSHRRNRQLMYDTTTGRMTEGIGHYRTRGHANRSRMEVASDTPYLCDVDFSIIHGIARHVEPKAHLTHAPGECRKNGDAACNYLVTW